MRIAWVTYTFHEYSVLHANAMADEHDVLLLMPKLETMAIGDQVASRVELEEFDKPRLRQPIRQWSSVRSLVRRIERFQPDVIHFQQGHLWFNLALRRLKKRYPLVITVHDPRHHAGDLESMKTPQWLMDYGFRQADETIVHGRALADQVHTLFGHPRENIHVIPHVALGGAIDGDCMVPEQPKTILFFGRIWDYKGLDYLIRAEPLISKRVPNVKIVIAGTGDDFSKYEAMMTNPERFEILHRWIGDDEQAKLFQQAAIVVLPYIEATQSGVVPVAQNYAKAVVATSVGALPDCVEHEVTGLLVPPRDEQQLADALVRLLNDPEQRRGMGAAGRKRLLNEATPEKVAAATLDVYHRAMNARSFASSRGARPCAV